MNKSILENVIDMKGLSDRVKARLDAKSERENEGELKRNKVYTERELEQHLDLKCR